MTLILDNIGQCDVKQAMMFNTNKNNFSFEGINKH